MKKQTNPSTKAHLLWSALILLALGAICAIPFALGQREAVKLSVINPAAKIDAAANKYMQQVTQRADGAISDQPLPKISQTGQSQLPATSSGAIGVGRLRILPNPNLPQVVLYDQYNNASPTTRGRQRSPISPPLAPIWLTILLCREVRLGMCNRLTPTGGTSRALDLPAIGMFSFTPTAVLFLALKFSACSTSRSR